MKQSLLISLSLIFVLCFGVAFAYESDTTGTNTASLSTNLAALTEDIIKQIITKQENNLTKYSTGPKSVTVTFESIKIGKARKANKADEYEGIPPGATIYPVRAKYTAVHHYNDGDQEKKYHYDYYFYQDSFDEWATLGLGPVR